MMSSSRKKNEKLPEVPQNLKRASKSNVVWVKDAEGKDRPVPRTSRRQRSRAQALTDFFGVDVDEPLDSHMRSMESLLSEISSKLDLREQSIAPEMLAGVWAGCVGDYLAAQAELVSIDGGVACVRSAHPAVRFELNRLRSSVLARLNKRLGAGSVRRLRLVHG